MYHIHGLFIVIDRHPDSITSLCSVKENDETLTSEEKALLIELENIVGQMFFNYRGDQMAYPLKYDTAVNGIETTAKCMVMKVENTSDEILSARYVVGANHIRIYKALYNVVQNLKERHGLNVPGFPGHFRS